MEFIPYELSSIHSYTCFYVQYTELQTWAPYNVGIAATYNSVRMSNGLYDKVYLSNSYVNLKLYENPNPELLRAFKLQESIQESCITRSIAVGIASSLLGNSNSQL